MKREQVISIDGQSIYTNGGRRIEIGNGEHKVGEWVWVDSGCVFGHQVPAAQLPYVPNIEGVYIEMYSSKDHSYHFRLITIKANGRKIVKDDWCAVPITPTKVYGRIVYEFSNGHFVYNSKGFVFFEHVDTGMNVHLYKDGVWSKGMFDACNLIKAEFIDGDLYWAGANINNYLITSYKDLTEIKSLDFTKTFMALFADFKSYAQGMIDDFILQHGTQKYILTDKDITKTWLPYYEGDDIRSQFSIFISPMLYENANTYHSYDLGVDRYYLGKDIYEKARHLACDNIVYVNDEHIGTDISITYGVDHKYKILSTTEETYYTLVDMENNSTYDWTPFKTLLKGLFSQLFGTIIVIAEVNADTLYIYIEGANFIFSKSQKTLTAINKSGFYIGNQQLSKIPKAVANKIIQSIKDELGS